MKLKGAPTLILILLALALTGYFGYKNYRSTVKNLVLTPSPTSVDTTGSKVEKCLAATICKGNTPCMANPASVFCICMGGEEKIVNSSLGQSGVCKIDGNEYDEWEYFRRFAPSQ
ncbi:hypothetical protein A2V56_04665 [Candidatus Woesebacteria bacterium RBG_19FT_COMBO_42_9]|nr:MAG: hypothetical protein A2V56_04665 [Candidatus Woesebacteria bacterium RBG_19FT_COMBO_42_9]